MGCISSPKNIKINSVNFVPNKDKVLSKSLRWNYIHNKKFFNKTNKSNWTNIVDYLNFQELKEVGKASKELNSLVKQHQILVKFFKKKEYVYIYSQQNNICLKKMESFAMLGNIDNISVNSDDDSYCSTSLNTDSSIN
jgi:hypothetical protein